MLINRSKVIAHIGLWFLTFDPYFKSQTFNCILTPTFGILFLERELFITGHVTFKTIFPLLCAMSYYLWACIHSTNVFLIILNLSSFLNLILTNIVCIYASQCAFYMIVLITFVYSNTIPIVSKSVL